MTLEAYASSASGTSQPLTINPIGSDPVVLHGTVVDQYGHPLGGAEVYLSGFEDYQEVTDASGRYAFTGVMAMSYTLWAEHGTNPRRESDRVQALWLDNRGARTQPPLRINSYSRRTPVLLVPGILGSTQVDDGGFIPLLPKDPAVFCRRVACPRSTRGQVEAPASRAPTLAVCPGRVGRNPAPTRAC